MPAPRARAAALRLGRGRESDVCPYHSWAYSLSGELRGAPGFRDLDAAGWTLTPLPAAEWHGLVFVDGSGGAAGRRARRVHFMPGRACAIVQV